VFGNFLLELAFSSEWRIIMLNGLINNLIGLDCIPCRQLRTAIESVISKKILKTALLIFITAGCALQRKTGRTYRIFLGNEGWVAPTLMISTYLALKYILYLEQKDDNISDTRQPFIWIKRIPENFGLGFRELPRSLNLTISTAIIAELIFRSLSFDTSMSFDPMQLSMLKVTVLGPFLEELFFREFVQGSLIYTMKVINLIRFRMEKKILITEETIHTFSRFISATTFGLAHSDQNLTQSIVAGVSSYYCETLLYEKNGLFASFGHHFANNFYLFCLEQVLSNTKHKR
jgi:membrane protease YdiL (CAAX protease family)